MIPSPAHHRLAPVPDLTSPSALDRKYGAILRSCKDDFVTEVCDTTVITQHGAAAIATPDWPGWPCGLAADEPIIETFVAGLDEVVATSENEPFVSAWMPLAAWMNRTVRTALADVDVHLAGDAFITASLTPTALLEGVAHLDDDQFLPSDSVSMVAIIGDLAGPRIATAPVPAARLRPLAPVVFPDELLDSFARDALNRCVASAQELVVFPQFGQLHAGPAAEHVAHLAASRQLLVMRAAVHPRIRSTESLVTLRALPHEVLPVSRSSRS